MAGKVSNEIRNLIISEFRERVCSRLEVAPFLHQRQVWAATDGLELTGEVREDPFEGSVTVSSGRDTPILHAATRSRPGGRARFVSDLGAFKIGKSFGAALWASGFAAVPGARVALVGLEYDICEPEFSYLVEFLLSSKGMNLKAESLQNRPRDGKMWLDLSNGCRYEARSWERKDSLKGKENDAYIYCEAYQLPGIECFTGFSQNLRVREGYAYFATTPDRPWIKDLHKLGYNHGGEDADPQWHCTCSVPADVNPFSFDPVAKERDKKLMTREKYEIHYNGQLGDFVGHVFNFQRGAPDQTFNHITHPDLFDESGSDRHHLRLPTNFEIVGGADTGTNYSALLVAFDPDGIAYVLEEFPNYLYVAGSLERDESLSIPRWSARVVERAYQLGGRANFWADPNSQFKGELRHYGVTLLPAKVPVETRTEITREYFEHSRIRLAPWLLVLPFELENAQWPEEASMSGKFQRVKDRDHTLDCLEHILARRPFGRIQAGSLPKGSWAAGEGLRKAHQTGNTHLGAH